MPEPPSLGGTGPGVWRLTFTIPGWMAPELGRTWLQFGTVIVPLPVAVPAQPAPSVDRAPPPPPHRKRTRMCRRSPRILRGPAASRS